MIDDVLERNTPPKGYSRLCIPRYLSLLELHRWVVAIKERHSYPRFVIDNGEQPAAHTDGNDVIQLMADVGRLGLDWYLSDSCILEKASNSMIFIDQHERFAFFLADDELCSQVYPHPIDVMREHFIMRTENDADATAAEIFDKVHVRGAS